VSNWIYSGGHAPRPNSDDLNNNGLATAGRHRAWRLRRPLRYGVPVLLVILVSQLVQARDRGQFANTNSEIKAWFDTLRSGKGPCCSDADGTAVSDVDWESRNGHYRVRLEGDWIDVPEEAVITEPNRVGRTMVWPIRGYGGLSIRCFMPGSMT
jgi:hypothetical protein